MSTARQEVYHDATGEKDALDLHAVNSGAAEQDPKMQSWSGAAETFGGAVLVDAELTKALQAAPLKGLSKSAIRLYLCLMIAFMASIQNGFDGSIMSNINAMHQYLDYFGYSQAGASTGWVFVSYQVGNVIGAFFAGFICDRFGRRGGLIVYATIIVIAASLSAASQNPGWFVGTRVILGLGISLATTVGPTYATELAPPQWRGRCVGAYNSFYFVGSILVNATVVGTTHLESTAAWRIPLGLQLFPAITVLIAVWFVPESPRWLVARGRIEEAQRIFADLHGGGDLQNPLVLLEMREVMESNSQLQADKQLRWWDFMCLFNTKAARWRTLMVTLMSIFGQWTGNGLGYFFPVLYAGAGVTNQNTQLLLSFINSLISAGGAAFGSAVADRVGRRPRLIFGTAWITLTMIAAFALTHVYGAGGTSTNQSGANAAIFFLFLYGVSFAVIYTPLQSLFCSESLSNGTRAKGMAYHTLVVNVALCVNTFGISVALASIGNYVYLIYVGWCAIETVVWYFFCVEMRGRSLEELDEIFNSPNPVKASRRQLKMVRDAEGGQHVKEVYGI